MSIVMSRLEPFIIEATCFFSTANGLGVRHCGVATWLEGLPRNAEGTSSSLP